VMSTTAGVPIETIFREAVSPQISCNSGMICITEVITPFMSLLLDAACSMGSDDEEGLARGEKLP
jgi:hypothetical protein